MNITPHHPALPERFLTKVTVDPDTGCWSWQAATNEKGYAKFKFKGRVVRGHRYAYEQVHGVKLPRTVCARHTCDRPGCVNPAHIKPGSPKDNSDDKVRKGRQASKLSARVVWTMRCLYNFGGDTYESLAETFGVSASNAHRAVVGQTWAHVPCPRNNPAGYAPEFDAAGVMVLAPEAPPEPLKDAA